MIKSAFLSKYRSSTIPYWRLNKTFFFQPSRGRSNNFISDVVSLPFWGSDVVAAIFLNWINLQIKIYHRVTPARECSLVYCIQGVCLWLIRKRNTKMEKIDVF